MIIPKINPSKDWYISSVGALAKQSPTEARIKRTLLEMNIKFFQEVSFKGFGYETLPYRFDFYIPSLRLVIEYDGSHHRKEKVHNNDLLKDAFCRKNNIKIIRFNKKDYKILEQHVFNAIHKRKK